MKPKSIIVLDLPLPPSTNAAFARGGAGHRTGRTAAYRWWIRCVLDEFRGKETPRLTAGEYALWLDLPSKMRGDTDNRLKLVSDMLKEGPQKLGVVSDDRFMRDHHVCPLFKGVPGRCTVTLVSLASGRQAWAAYVGMRIC